MRRYANMYFYLIGVCYIIGVKHSYQTYFNRFHIVIKSKDSIFANVYYILLCKIYLVMELCQA